MLKVGFNRHFQTCIVVLALLLLSAAASAQPTFSQPPEEAAEYGTLYTYNINTSWPLDRDVTVLSPLPAWLEFTPHPNGTATLTGIPNVAGAIPTITIKVEDRLVPALFSTQDINITVAKAQLTAHAVNKSKIYGQANPALTISYTGFKFTDGAGGIDTPPTVSTAADEFSVVGNHAIELDITGAFDDHYTFARVDGILQVTPAVVTVTAQNKSKVYGEANPTPTFTYTGFQNGQTESVLTTAPSGSYGAVNNNTGVGNSYPITPSGAVATNYTFSYVNGTLTITHAPLIISVDDETKVYGQANPSYTIRYSGFQNTDNNTVLTAQPSATTVGIDHTSNAGAYTITVAGATAVNYSITHQNGTLTITKKALTVKANDNNRLYGDANPALSLSYTGFVNGDDELDLDVPRPQASTTAIGTTTVGTVTITASSAGIDNNYSYVFQDGTLTINKAHLTATANNQSRPYFAADPTFTITYGGLKNGENSSVVNTPPATSTTATQASNAGNYTINISGGSATNYDFTGYTTGTLTITKIALTAHANDVNRSYGAANPATFTISYTGFVNGETASVIATPPTAGTAATTASPVGTYSIDVNTTSALDENYTFNGTPGTLTIGKATLTATAEPKTRPYGSANPLFTILYSGFVNGETILNITTVPTASANATSSSDAGAYTITPSGGVDESYDFNYVTAPLTITKITLTATANNASKTYGDANPVFTISYSGFITGENSSVLEDPPVASTLATPASHVGNYAITLANGNDANYAFSFVPGTLTITKAVLVATADGKTRGYGAANPGFTISYTGFVNSDTEAVLDAPGPRPSASTTATVTSDVGNHTITVSGGTDDDYTFTYVPGVLSITKVNLTATADAKSRVYGVPNPAFSISYSGFLNGDTPAVLNAQPTASTTAVPASSVGTYPITLDGGADNNYNLVLVGNTLTIVQAPLLVTADNQSRAYGSDNPALTVSYAGFQNGDTPGVFTTPLTVTTTATAASPVGTYPITPSAAVATNYSISFVNGALTVNKAVLTATADNQTRTYGAANPTFTITYTGFVNGESILNITPGTASAPTATATANVGNYNIVPSGGSATNYSFSYVNGTLTITQATVTATANDATRTYGSSEPAFTASYSGFLNGQNSSVLTTQPTGATAATVNSDVGTYPITMSGAVALNYTFTYVPGTLTITKATLTATADNKAKTYGAANPPLTITYTGFRNLQDASVIATPPAITTTAVDDSNAGNYAITVSGGNDENYTFTYVAGTLSIGKAVLIATANDKTRVYGAVNPPFTLTYAGLLNDDVPGDITTAPSMATVAIATSVVGNYAITVSGGTDENYTFSYVPGTLSIGKALLTAKPDNKVRTYGAVNPTFTIAYTGFANGETAAVIDVPAVGATVATVTSDVGTYDITASGASDFNYDFAYNPGILTINKALLTLTANNQGRAYGAANPPLTITYGGLQNGETAAVLDDPAPSASTTAIATSPVGNYPITITAGTDNNYAFSIVNGTLAISKATLTVTADNKTRTYNTANPSFTLSYSGFLNADNVGSITPPTGATSAVINSPVGNYTINVSGGAATNYAFSFVSGTLTITKATPNIAWTSPAAIIYGTPLSSTQLNATATFAAATVTGTFDYTPAGGTVLNAGAGQTLSVDFTPSDLTNYNTVIGTTTTITVNKATPVITWPNPAPITYGTPLSSGPGTQLNATTPVDGTFAYTPAAGTILNAGVRTLSADFTPANPNNYNPVTNIQRSITVNKATPTVTWANPAPITFGTPLGGAQQNSTFSVPGTPTYIPGAGTLLPTGPNQAITVNWAPADAANYNPVNGTTVLITVLKATPNITWPAPADITYGTALTLATNLNASASVGGSFDFVPPAGTVLSAGAGQTLTATFVPTDQVNYNTVTGITRTINVNKANPVITWAAPSPITYGTALSGTQLSASGSVPGVSTYNPPSGTVLNAGLNQTLTSTFTPTDVANYNVIVTNRTITVNKATPTITWPTPGAITYGTPLTEGAQLAAVGSVPGTPVYSPLPGTILNAGAGQTLSVTYTPTDGANYNVATASRFITVDKATPVVTWATPLPIKTGVALDGSQLNATADVPGLRIYTPPAGTSYPTEGTYPLSVRFEPTDATNYNIVPVTQVQLTVSSKENPVITWNTPADITYGTLLSSAQNNATANVPGTRVYSPADGVRLNAGANQTLTVTFTPTDLVNYNVVQKTVQINVNKATLTATASNANRNYGAANPSFVITYTGFVGTQTAAVIDTPPTATCSAIGSDPAGSTFPIVPAGGTDNNYQFIYVNGTLGINKAPLTATAENKSREYGLSNPAFTISYTGFVNGDNEADITQPTAATTALVGSSVGNYPITLSGGAASNYNITLQPGTLSITKTLLVVLGNNLTRLYGQANPPLTFLYAGFRNGDTESAIATPPTATTPATITSSVGTYAINITGGSATNYQLQNFPGSLTITKAALTAKADNKTRTYGAANPANSITYTGFMNADGPASITPPTITGPAATVTSDAGTYPILLSGGSATNYDLTLQNGTLTVAKAVLNAKADNKSRMYGQANPTFTLTITGYVNGDDAGDINSPTASTTATSTSPVATYLITVAGGSATNYTFTYQSGSLTIDPASLIARANDRTRMYGQNNPTLTITYTGFLNGDDVTDLLATPSPSTTASPTSNIGTYPITLTGGTALNYTLTLQSGTMTIAKATLTVTADNLSRPYGSNNPPLTVSYAGFQNGQTPAVFTQPLTVSTTATPSSPVRDYTITPGGAVANNYSISFVNGTLTVTKAQLTAKADNKSRQYGGTNPEFTITYTGFVAGDTPASIDPPDASTVAVATSDVGTYPITLSGTTDNYAYTFQDGTLTVNKTLITVTANNRTKIYGANNPTLTLSYSGLVNSENTSVIDTPPTAATTATAASPVGNYPITLSGGSDNNYSFTFVPGTLTVSKAALTAKADNKQRFYGDPNPPNSITYTGFVNGDTPASITQPVPSSAATPTSPLGDYPIVLTGGSATNYTLTLQPGTLSVIPAILTVTAVSQSKTYGAPNPILTLTYSGFATGHSVSDIDVLPIATTSATVASNVGTYPITVSGGLDGNYAFVYASGTMNVTKAPVTATADNKTTTYGTVPPLTITYTGFMNGEDHSVLDTPPAISTTATVTSSPAIYPITLAGGADNNYNITSNSGALTVGKATLTAKADDKSRITGVANPALTITYTGFVNSETADVLDVKPTATTAAVTASPAGTYAIDVAAGSDGNYAFVYQAGTLTVVLDNPPVLKNFQVETEEDKQFNFTLALFTANTTDEPDGKIAYIKIMTLPQNGVLFKGATRLVAGDEIKVTDGQMEAFYYLPNNNYNGSDTFTWNLYDGSYLAVNPATITVKVTPINDPPVLSNIEPDAILYSPGDPKVQLSNAVIVNDIDDSDVWSATISIHTNFTRGDLLEVEGISPKIIVQFDAQKGELNLTGKDARSNYETALRKVTFTSPVSASEIISDKSIGFVVRDSVATSNITSRVLSITEVLPEINIVNAFTPNGDGVNDKWDVLGLGAYSKIDIRIFDTHGNLVFTCAEKVCEWDGTVKGKALPAGPYLYSIDLNDGKRKYKGLVTILK